MNRAQQFFLGFSLILFIAVFSSGCVHTKSCRYLEATAGQVFLSPQPHFEEPSFAKWAGQNGQSDRIRYLLERTAGSGDRFIRNGQTHDGKEARMWLLYKMGHWVNGVETAEDFISSVASFSKKTGEPYLVEDASGRIYSLSSVLRNELSAFDTRQRS